MTAIYALVLAAAVAPPAASPAPNRVVSTGKPTSLADHLYPERPTVFVFLRPGSSLERAFVADLQKGSGGKVPIREIHLRTGTEPVARQHQVASTPTGLVYDRRGRLVGRSSSPDEIGEMVARAARVMRIDWVEEGDPRYAEMEKILGRQANDGIMRTMSLRPEWMKEIFDLHRKQHRPDTAIDRRTKEMIATYVSALNKCKF